MRAALYGRVSTTKDKGQDAYNQMRELRRYAEAQKWFVTEYIDYDAARDGFRRVLDAASRRQIDVLLVWSLDRLPREGVGATFRHIHQLGQYGVQFESFTEPHFRTTGPAGEPMIALAAWVAKQERLRISERTKAGLARARAEGRIGGRPEHIFRRDHAAELRQAGMSWRQIEKAMGVPQFTVRGALRRAGANEISL